MRLPAGTQILVSYDEVKQAWGDVLTIPPEPDAEIPEGRTEAEGTVIFADEPRIAITVDGVFVELRKPIRSGVNLELDNIVFIREPTVDDIRLADKYKGEMDKAICLFGALTGAVTADIGKMPASDFALCSGAVGPFLSQ